MKIAESEKYDEIMIRWKKFSKHYGLCLDIPSNVKGITVMEHRIKEREISRGYTSDMQIRMFTL